MRKLFVAFHFVRVSTILFFAAAMLSTSPLSIMAAPHASDSGSFFAAPVREVAKTLQTNPREKDMTATSQDVARTLETNPREKDMTAASQDVARTLETNTREKDMTATVIVAA